MVRKIQGNRAIFVKKGVFLGNAIVIIIIAETDGEQVVVIMVVVGIRFGNFELVYYLLLLF